MKLRLVLFLLVGLWNLLPRKVSGKIKASPQGAFALVLIGLPTSGAAGLSS